MVDKTAKPMKSFFVTPPFREGQSARPLSVGCGVSRRMGRLWIETYIALTDPENQGCLFSGSVGCRSFLPSAPENGIPVFCHKHVLYFSSDTAFKNLEKRDSMEKDTRQGVMPFLPDAPQSVSGLRRKTTTYSQRHTSLRQAQDGT